MNDDIIKAAGIAAEQQDARCRALIAWMDSQEIPNEERAMFLALCAGHYLGKIRKDRLDLAAAWLTRGMLIEAMR